jgi:kynurenine formamidase
MNIFDIDRVIDLSHSIDQQVPLWSDADQFELSTLLTYDQCTISTKFCVQGIKMPCGTGTHIDAPAHVDPKGLTVDQISLKQLIVPLVVIDFITQDAMRQLSVEDVEAHEKKYGIIESDSLVVIKTGWSRYWHNVKQYRNQYQFPSVLKEAAQFLLERNVVALGIDTLSPDGADDTFPVHNLFLGSGKYLLENLSIPVTISSVGLMACVMPLKIKGATEAPCRVFAF